jgi:hypothetical protein
MKRQAELDSLKTHPFYKNYFKKIKKDQVEFMNKILLENEHLTKEEFSQKVCRVAMMDNKPKDWATCEELLSVANNLLK